MLGTTGRHESCSFAAHGAQIAADSTPAAIDLGYRATAPLVAHRIQQQQYAATE